MNHAVRLAADAAKWRHLTRTDQFLKAGEKHKKNEKIHFKHFIDLFLLLDEKVYYIIKLFYEKLVI